MVEDIIERKAAASTSEHDKPKGSVRVCIRVRPQLKREVVYKQVVEAVSVSWTREDSEVNRK